MSDTQDDVREWLRDQLSKAGHGARQRLARHLGFSRPDAITRMLNTDPRKETREIKARELQLMREFFGASPAAPGRPSDRLVRVPDLAIFAGMGGGGALEVRVDADGNPMDPDQVRGFWQFPEYMVRRLGSLRNVYAWEVRGDSMEPTLHGGAVVFVDTSQRTPPPDDIYALDAGDGLVVKRLRLVPRSPTVEIISDNEHYPPDRLPREDVTVWGRVVAVFQWRG